MHDFIENKEKPCKFKWVNSSVSIFFIFYVNEIFLIRNDISYIIENKDFTIIIVLHKGLEKSIPHPWCWCENPSASEKLESRESRSSSGPAKEV